MDWRGMLRAFALACVFAVLLAGGFEHPGTLGWLARLAVAGLLGVMPAAVDRLALVVAAKRSARAQAATPPPLETPQARYPRTGLDPAGPANAHLLGICPVCGWEDPALVLEDATWGGWPAHRACAEWVGPHKPPGPEPLTYFPGNLVMPYVFTNGPTMTGPLVYEGDRIVCAPPAVRSMAMGDALIEGEPVPPCVLPGGDMSLVVVDPGAVEWRVELPASDPVNPRIDVVFMCDGPGLPVVSGIPGTPEPSPVAPATPSGARMLALVYVLPGSAAIVQRDILVL